MKKEFKFGTDLDGKAKEELIRLAYEGKERSYAPYSGFQVGAALLAENGTVYLGCNIENAAYSATNCAERTAFFQAVSEGVKEFRAIAIVGGPKGSKKGELCAPCGVCRQVMMEFCDPKRVSDRSGGRKRWMFCKNSGRDPAIGIWTGKFRKRGVNTYDRTKQTSKTGSSLPPGWLIESGMY